MARNDVSHLKQQVRVKQQELRRLLREWDPLGVYERGSTWPADEYDCLLGLLSRLMAGATAGELAEFLGGELRNHFGVDPKQADPEGFAKRLYAWYWTNPLPGSSSTS